MKKKELTIKDLENKYSIYGYKLGNGKWDTIFSLDTKNNKKALSIEPPMSAYELSITKGIQEIIKNSKVLTFYIKPTKNEISIIKDYYIKNFGNPDWFDES